MSSSIRGASSRTVTQVIETTIPQRNVVQESFQSLGQTASRSQEIPVLRLNESQENAIRIRLQEPILRRLLGDAMNELTSNEDRADAIAYLMERDARISALGRTALSFLLPNTNIDDFLSSRHREIHQLRQLREYRITTMSALQAERERRNVHLREVSLELNQILSQMGAESNRLRGELSDQINAMQQELEQVQAQLIQGQETVNHLGQEIVRTERRTLESLNMLEQVLKEI